MSEICSRNVGRACERASVVGSETEEEEALVSTAMESAGHQGSKLGLAPGLVVQELGWDSDVDDDVRGR